MNDPKRTIAVLEQAKNEIDNALANLRVRFDSGAIFAIDDAMICLKTAMDDIKASR